ncbi:MAG: VWA domain-containing protein [Burkholderiaceae bacterium]|nr:VWA domain-containing protein [Burkholderiaceae bacterium]
MTPAAQPLQAIAGFAATLRDHGFGVGIAEQQAMVQAALALPPERSRALEAAWRAIACHRQTDWRRWPELFERYWHPGRTKGTARVSGQTRPLRDLRLVVQTLHDQLASAPGRGDSAPDAVLDDTRPDADDGGRSQAQGGATRTDPLHDRALAQWLPQDLARLKQLADRIAERLRRRLTRRWQADAGGRRLDLRRTLRASLATGGVPVKPAWRRARRERPRLFILVDVSRSMEMHAQLFLRSARAFVGAAGARVFVFHTRLAEVTPLLQRDSATVQEKVNAVAAGFGGGTRIATSVDDFVQRHARAQLSRGARVWLLSDGFDADPPDALAGALARVRGHGARIVWFHPAPQPPASDAVQRARAQVQAFVRLASLRDLEAATPLLH